MRIFLNGVDYSLIPNGSIYSLLEELQLLEKRIAIEVNGQIIPRSQHKQLQLQNGDKVEVIHAIGGG